MPRLKHHPAPGRPERTGRPVPRWPHVLRPTDRLIPASTTRTPTTTFLATVPARSRPATARSPRERRYTYDAVGDLLGTTARARSGAQRDHPGAPAYDGRHRRWRPWSGCSCSRPRSTGPTPSAPSPGSSTRSSPGGMLVASGGEVRAALDCRPYADDDHDWWVVSDLTPGLDGQPIRVDADHVLGVSPASTSLAQLTVREPVARALDLGTGCGVQALHLSGHADDVVATDVNPRALGVTAFNAALNEIRVDVRDGSLWEPVADERVRPRHHQPAVRDLARDRPAARLPRLRAPRRPGRRGDRARRAGPPHRRRLVPGRWRTGRSATVCPGTSGSRGGSPRTATRSSSSARCSTPRRTSSSG